MIRLPVVLLLAVFGSAIALSDVNQRCIAENNEAFSNDNLIGTWYQMFKMTLMVSLLPSTHCPERNFTRPSADIIQQYKNKYNDPNAPYNIDENPVQVVDLNRIVNGLVMGHNTAKFYVVTPNTTSSLNSDGYTVDAYRLLTPKYLMYTECSLRGFTRWLWSTDRYAPYEEMDALIKSTSELRNMERQRYCATY